MHSPKLETFGMLISRSYLMIITPEEKKLRDSLAQTIRVRPFRSSIHTITGSHLSTFIKADFGQMMEKLQETSLEISWSRFV